MRLGIATNTCLKLFQANVQESTLLSEKKPEMQRFGNEELHIGLENLVWFSVSKIKNHRKTVKICR